MLIESMSRRSKSGVSASTRTPFCLSSLRRMKSSNGSISESGIPSPPGLQAIRDHATVVLTDVWRGIGAVEIRRVEFLRIAELLGEVLQHAGDAHPQWTPGRFRCLDPP